MKKYLIALIGGLMLFSTSGCKKYLDINTDPDTPQNPSNSSVLPAMLAGMTYGIQRDARYIAKYIQNWNTSGNANNDAIDRHGYVYIDNNMGDIWWMNYFSLGNNLEYIIENGIRKNQPDHVGVAYALKAWSFQTTTDLHGELIFREAWKEGLYQFKYDSQSYVYQGVDSLCHRALNYLNLAETKTDNTLNMGDYVYNGNIVKWKKFVYGILARNWHRVTNKTSLYQADSVIKYIDLSFESITDDFIIPFDGTKNDNSNFFGTFRNNLGTVRQSNFIVRLLDGTTLAGSNAIANRDPRIRHMLSVSQDTLNGNGGYRGVDPGVGDPLSASTTGANARKRVAALWGDSIYANPSSAAFSSNAGKYLFRDKAIMPVMTYSELQFMKAEAAFKKGYTTTAYTAYKNGINAHFDLINRNYSSYRGGPTPLINSLPISTDARNLYLTGANVKQDETTLTLSDIMLQKYIAMWGWGFVETWVDLRRYHYQDFMEGTTDQVYKGFNFVLTFAAGNEDKPAYRVRPNYRSEYSYNLEQLKILGGTLPNYHTFECWFSKPE